MPLTLAQARTTVLEHLDDDGTRWSTTQVDRALSLALSQCVDDYIASGGERFDLVDDVATDSLGVVDLGSLDPLVVRAVSVREGYAYTPLRIRALEDIDAPDETVRTLRIRYVPKFALPAGASDPLAGDAGVSWDTFDHWVCVRAAIFASTKDAEDRPELVALEKQLAASILTLPRTPKAVPFPRPARNWGILLSWSWSVFDQSVTLSRRLF